METRLIQIEQKNARLGCTKVMEDWTEVMLSENNVMSAVEVVCVCVRSCECIKLYLSVIYLSTYLPAYLYHLSMTIYLNK